MISMSDRIYYLESWQNGLVIDDWAKTVGNSRFLMNNYSYDKKGMKRYNQLYFFGERLENFRGFFDLRRFG